MQRLAFQLSNISKGKEVFKPMLNDYFRNFTKVDNNGKFDCPANPAKS